MTTYMPPVLVWLNGRDSLISITYLIDLLSLWPFSIQLDAQATLTDGPGLHESEKGSTKDVLGPE